MKVNYLRMIGGAILVSGILVSMTMAGEGNEGQGRARGKHRGEIQKFHKAQMEARRDFFKGQMEDNKAFHESLRDMQPNEACLKMITHRQEQRKENVAFMAKQHEAAITFFTNLMKEDELSEEMMAARIEKMNERFQEMKERRLEHFTKVIATLKELSAREDLTWEEIREAMKGLRPEREDKPGKGKGKGERRGRGKRNRPSETTEEEG